MNTPKALSKIEPSESAIVAKIDAEESVNIESILRFAIEKQVPVDTMERLLGMQERVDAKRAKRGFDAALSAFQNACPSILKNKAGANTKAGVQMYKYAPLDVIVEQVKPLLQANGFSYTLTSEVDKDWVKALCKITHTLGHSEVSEFKVPVDPNAGSMSMPQRYGSSLTFASRRAFCNAFGILTADSDTDAAPPRDRHGEARTTTEPAKPSMTPAQITEALHGRIWNRLSPLPQFKGKTDEETWAKIDKWIVAERMMEPAESFEKLGNDRLERIATAAEETFDAAF